MTFAPYEISTEDSQPIEIYVLTLGTIVYYYTSSEVDIVVDSITYTALPGLQRNKVTEGRGSGGNALKITMPTTNEFVQKFISIVPGSRAQIEISRVQRLDAGLEKISLFTGYVNSVEYLRQGMRAELDVTPATSAFSRPIPRYTYQSLCNHTLYDDQCGVDRTDSTFRADGSVVSVSANEIVVTEADSFVDGFFTGGFVEYNFGEDARLVLKHVGDTLTLLLPFPFDALGKSVTVFAGCDHSISTCDSKFFTSEDTGSNVINYGGFAFVPLRNIFTSGLIY
jgi:uncharacterized phage protein (TIGR02218 family)